ncbi:MULTISPECIES: AbrB family transcriptional regulator [Rhodopseudomonas]|uniref:Membrane protein n=1 Tax=Rhodopseudomonas palustris TaxID=1076 RepID=A0A0D7F4I5_RHOPL|nr:MULTISPECIES: AbrB family transcriptional regulator [Rhodopseudomonas]KIZ48003.1 membrane protein [Rhodopseudomonas palustris]MDF3812109.1 AbrB family transcriptional regulator [Rhodopseudomonas sp. BAL398]WOK16569.1 AbrB family transcriptional regulator [Rhodopseudomonas sp. BAL398]
MSEQTPPPSVQAKTLNVLETVLIGIGGGALFYWAQLPGGLITGAMVAVAAAGLSGRKMGLPQPLAHVILMTLGLSLGSMVSPAMIHNLSAYPVTIAMLAAATFCSTFGSSYYLQWVHGWDRTSALLAGSPGALSQIIMLATERKADVPGIAVVQIMRVIILTGAVPMLLAASGMMGHGPLPSRGPIATPLALAELAAVAVAAALLLRWLKFPAAWMFGAMLGSSVLHGAGLVEGTLPQWAYIAALTGIGTLIGSRFGAIRLRTILSHLGAALGSFAVAIAISSVFVTAIALTMHVKFSDVVVAFAPGAMDAMLALALTLHVDPVFVGAHHLSRFIFVSIATPGIVHLFGRAADDLDD